MPECNFISLCGCLGAQNPALSVKTSAEHPKGALPFVRRPSCYSDTRTVSKSHGGLLGTRLPLSSWRPFSSHGRLVASKAIGALLDTWPKNI